MAFTKLPKTSFQNALLNRFVDALKEEYFEIVKKHKTQIDLEFDQAVARKIVNMSVFLSEHMSITDLGTTIRLEIVKYK